MADKSVGELIAAQSVTPTDLFVLEQNGAAKKLTGQILENWLVSFADGHGGIQSIVKHSTDVLVDTYRITLADTTTFDFVVNNGRGINTIEKTGTSGLVDTYTITFNDATSSTFEVVNGAKGDKGDNTYTHIKYASQKPTASSHSMGDVADNWIGIYFGASETAPTDWTQYEWFQIKGEKGDTGEAARLMSSAVEYQISDSGTIIPSGVWSSAVPVVAQGKYLWTRTTNNFNTGSSVVSYSVSRMGLDGSGSVSSVANISPDENGNVPLTAANIGALPNTGGDMTGEMRMNGNPIRGLNMPTENDQAANMGFVNQQMKKAAPRNLLDNSDFRNPVNQRGQTNYKNSGYTIDRWSMWIESGNGSLTVHNGYISIMFENHGSIVQYLEKGVLDSSKTYTLAIKTLDDGVQLKYPAYIVHGENTDTFYLTDLRNGDAMNVEWIALYEGEYFLDTLPEYQPKGYATELAECQRYAIPFLPSQQWGTLLHTAIAISDTTIQVYIPGSPLRPWVNPVINFTASDVFINASKSGVTGVPSSISVAMTTPTGVIIDLYGFAGLSPGEIVFIKRGSESGQEGLLSVDL